jgi:septum formation protein
LFRQFCDHQYQNDECCLIVLLLLASASPARRRLLEQAQIPHQVMVSGVDEDQIQHPDPAQLVQLLAEAKASAVKLKVEQSLELTPSIKAVLGCDSVLAFEGEVFGKPRDEAEAISRWQRMRGNWAELHTGHCLLLKHPIPETTSRYLTCVTTRVGFASICDKEIESYVASGEPLHCAGGFALEGMGGMYVERLDGCFSNVIGLSLPLLRQWMSLTSK